VVSVLGRRPADASAAALFHFSALALSELFESCRKSATRRSPPGVLLRRGASALDDAPQALVDKVEQVVKLIRSKGVGVFFVTQNTLGSGRESVLAQLGNRVQHASARLIRRASRGA
jgi:hypothetical protein